MPYTRISEYKHLTGQQSPVTTITYEYPSAEGDPYYPIPRPENQELFKRYEALGDATEGVTFVGRLATYRYYNMDQIVGQALATFRRLDERRQQRCPNRGRAKAEPAAGDEALSNRARCPYCSAVDYPDSTDLSPRRPSDAPIRRPMSIRCWTRIFPIRR